MKNEKELRKLIEKKIEDGTLRQKIIKAVNEKGLSKHCMWILDLLILGRDYHRIRNILLFTQDKFESKIEELYLFLESFELGKK